MNEPKVEDEIKNSPISSSSMNSPGFNWWSLPPRHLGSGSYSQSQRTRFISIQKRCQILRQTYLNEKDAKRAIVTNLNPEWASRRAVSTNFPNPK